MIKKQFTLYIENRPGNLARITRRLAQSNINIEGISLASSADVGLVQVVVSNAAQTRRLLRELDVAFTVQDVALLSLRNEPGALSRIVSRLARHKVNVNYVYATACSTSGDARCYCIISAPDLDKVLDAYNGGAKGKKTKPRKAS